MINFEVGDIVINEDGVIGVVKAVNGNYKNGPRDYPVVVVFNSPLRDARYDNIKYTYTKDGYQFRDWGNFFIRIIKLSE